jgi:hypothetical protein
MCATCALHVRFLYNRDDSEQLHKECAKASRHIGWVRREFFDELLTPIPLLLLLGKRGKKSGLIASALD